VANRKILLDSCVPRPFKRELTPHHVQHTSEIGWQDLDDRPLLESADGSFDVFITTDQNLLYQQNLSRYSLSVIVLIAHTNRLEDLLPLVPSLLKALEAIQPGQIEEISS
jgi:hypothetical protein